MIAINGRFKVHRVTGMQRYAIELCQRLSVEHIVISPNVPLKGAKGHAWEQVVLPTRLKGRLLWSPCNTGPIAISRQVVTIHDLIPLEHPEWFSKEFVVLYRLVLPTLVRKSRHIIAVSEFTKTRLIQLMGTPETKISVIPNGISDQFRPRSETDVNNLRMSLGIPQGPYVLSVCSVEPRKNLALLLSAWGAGKGKFDGATLVIAGAKGNQSVFKAAQFNSPPRNVIFTGYVPDPDLPVLYSGASVFVYPSLYEGFGLPILEALACGTKVVASKTTSIPEVACASTTLIDPLSSQELTDALVSALQMETDASLKTARQEHAQRYTWQKCAASTEQTLLASE